ncbi:hypothetical protein LG324_13520 [Phycicoccus jejuensis]|uniref:hypothetical protein n=1 Tax=Phycicoccus jejuensis TaxID=367299 RepID=UPI00384F36FF
MQIAPDALVGHRLEAVTTQWHEFEGARRPEPVHVWLTVQDVGVVKLHTLDGLLLLLEQTAESAVVEMGEHGRLVLERGGPRPLAERVGETIRAVEPLEQFSRGKAIGVVGVLLGFEAGHVGIGDLGDELTVERWPGRWAAWDVRRVV